MFTVAAGQLNLREERLLAASLVPGGPEEGALPVEPSSASRSALVLYNCAVCGRAEQCLGRGFPHLINTFGQGTTTGRPATINTGQSPLMTVLHPSPSLFSSSHLLFASPPPEAKTCLQGGEGHEGVVPESS